MKTQFQKNDWWIVVFFGGLGIVAASIVKLFGVWALVGVVGVLICGLSAEQHEKGS